MKQFSTKIVIRSLIIFLLLLLIACNRDNLNYRQRLDLGGRWQFALDPNDRGITDLWYLSDLKDSIDLPGTTDSNKKGYLNRDTSTLHLNRIYRYEGPAWYRLKVIVPENFRDRNVRLHLERTRSSRVWIDSSLAGGARVLQTPQEFDVSDYLEPGEHYISIRIDNSLKLTPYGNVHIYADETQTNWNGIIGKIYLEAAPRTHITNLRVYPDIEKKKIGIILETDNGLNLQDVDIELHITRYYNGKIKQLPVLKTRTACKERINLEYELGKECILWDEYRQALYELTAVISDGEIQDLKVVPFGMRDFKTDGTRFSINGRRTFLRGKHDAAVFPLTGYTPTEVEDWLRVFRIAKSYGINHYRFHSYCPPEAAFTAADLEGIYLQAELPFWGGLDSDTIADMLKDEGFAMLKAYANHPSFVMFSHGNELWSGFDRAGKNIIAFREYDDRPLYTMGSNNGIGYVPPEECSDFFVAARTPYAFDTILTTTRLTHAFCDSRDGGILNTRTPSTDVRFDYAVSHIDIPVISHEIGQYQIYPDYNEIKKYTGVLRARNLEIFRNRLQASGMADMDSIFHMASGAWSALCYKAEMEAAIRTEGLGGFQLLDLQDFPGQGTALIGILDAFMDSKNVVTPREWTQSCDDVVLLLESGKYVWTNSESFNAEVVIANYSNWDIKRRLKWALKNDMGEILLEGSMDVPSGNIGGLTKAGEINLDLSSFSHAARLNLEMNLPGTRYNNSYPLWVFPPPEEISPPAEIFVSERLDAETLGKLDQGGKVLLFPRSEDVEDKSFKGLFPPDFWNYGMFKGISEWLKKPVSPGTLGLLTDPKHPLFNDFPTDFHSNWHWFSIVKASNSLILDDTPSEYRPIVQVIDNLERNHKLGLIFEFRVGNGKILVCMSRLPGIMDKPEAVQLYRSILYYMESEDFSPEFELRPDELIRLAGNARKDIVESI